MNLSKEECKILSRCVSTRLRELQLFIVDGQLDLKHFYEELLILETLEDKVVMEYSQTVPKNVVAIS